jgi:hypothetical protein
MAPRIREILFFISEVLIFGDRFEPITLGSYSKVIVVFIPFLQCVVKITSVE